MPLKTTVKVDSITNLSDARYCAGMCVDMVGFNTILDTEHYLSSTLFQEIRGWITGPSVVAEVYHVESEQALTKIITDYSPDYLELAIDDLKCIPIDSRLPLILKANTELSLDALDKNKNNIAFILLAEADKALAEKLKDYKVLIQLRSAEALQDIVDDTAIEGITLSGSPEVRPGYKEYGDLADVLEKLDID